MHMRAYNYIYAGMISVPEKIKACTTWSGKNWWISAISSGVKGFVFITKTGETSVHVQELTLLSKSLRPLPIVKEAEGQTFDAVTDPEFRYRQRYADLIINPSVKEVFVKRTKLINSMREFLNSRGALEVDTPVLQSIPGGAAARPFINTS